MANLDTSPLHNIKFMGELMGDPTRYRIVFVAPSREAAEHYALRHWIPLRAIVLVNEVEKAYGHKDIPYVVVGTMYDFPDPIEYQRIMSYASEHGWKELK